MFIVLSPEGHCATTGAVLFGRRRIFCFQSRPCHWCIGQSFLLGSRQPGHKQGALQIYGQPELASASGWEALRAALYQFPWVVYAKRPFAEPQHLIRYLGRYVNRVAIANHRIEEIDHGMIRFRYVDNRSQTEKSLTLTADEFIRRFLTHVLPWGYRRVRYSGCVMCCCHCKPNAMVRSLFFLCNVLDTKA